MIMITCIIAIILLLITVALIIANKYNFDYFNFREGSSNEIVISHLPSDRFNSVNNFNETESPRSYYSQYRWYSDRARGGCYPEEILMLPPGAGPRKNGSCPAVTHTQDECWKCCDARRITAVDREQCRIYCGGLKGGNRPSFDPQQFLYG